MKAIFKREFQAYFHVMTGYVFAAFFICAIGIYFMAMNLFSGYPKFSYSLYNSLFVLMIGIPILTMRSMAEDRHNKTDQMLLTAPVSVWEIVGGKYLAMVAVLALPMAFLCLCPLIIQLNGTAYLLSDYLSIFVFFLLGAVYISIGLFISSLTESQIISVVVTFLTLMVLNLWNSLVTFLPSSSWGSFIGFAVLILLVALIVHNMTKNIALSLFVGGVLLLIDLLCFLIFGDSFAGLLPTLLNYFAPVQCFNDLALYSTCDFKGLLLYASLIVLFLFLTVQSVQKRRWS